MPDLVSMKQVEAHKELSAIFATGNRGGNKRKRVRALDVFAIKGKQVLVEATQSDTITGVNM